MEFKMPEAKRERLEELLEYLGDTGNYSEYYNGNRAEDFKKCFDTESEWCWEYADIVLRGLEKRTVGPGGEGHHGVPRSFYGVKHNCHMIDAGNWFKLSYAEHVWAHYCAAHCGIGNMLGKMIKAFLVMYRIALKKKLRIMPSEVELLDAIPEMELRRIQAMEPQWAKVEAEGRTHKYEDPKQHRKDYYEANKEKIVERQKTYREANKENKAEYDKAYREANKEKLVEKKKAYYETNKEKIAEKYKANKEKIAERGKAYREVNKDTLAKKNKAYREANKEKIAERWKEYYEANKEMLAKKDKARREANKEKIAERQKTYRDANREKIAERQKTYREANKEMLLENRKAYREANKKKLAEQDKARYEAKIAAGYRRRKNPITGKKEWVFVGIQEKSAAA